MEQRFVLKNIGDSDYLEVTDGEEDQVTLDIKDEDHESYGQVTVSLSELKLALRKLATK